MMKTASCILVCNKDGEFLAISRKNDTFKYGLPGGKAEPTDSCAAHTAIREFSEETGIGVDELESFGFDATLVPILQAVEGDFLVTTFTFAHESTGFAIEDLRMEPEPGHTIVWLTESQLTDPDLSPFAHYNSLAVEEYRKL